MLHLNEVVIMYYIQKLIMHCYVFFSLRVYISLFRVKIGKVEVAANQNGAFVIPIVILLYMVNDFLTFFHLCGGMCAVGPIETARQDGFLALHKQFFPNFFSDAFSLFDVNSV